MGIKELIIPNREITLALLEKVKLPHHILNHSIKVTEKALEISKKIKKTNVNLELVEISSLLHDIGRSQTHGLDHGVVGGNIIRNRGFPEAIAKICECHVLGGLDIEDVRKYITEINPRDLNPKTIEEKIVCLADKYFKGDKEVDLEKRFRIWFRKYGTTELLIKSKKKVKKIETTLNDLM